MPPTDGWYLAGPLLAVTIVGALAGFMRWSVDNAPIRELYPDGLAIFGDPDDYGLLVAAALADDRELADDVRAMLTDAGIRSTLAQRPDGRYAVLVFTEDVEQARRLVGNSPPL
ncbi:MAG TPA: hypothetical protein VFO77_10265 [Actinoplanes sp.]|nr:hypothetical protein [Actinoplanes sp.]